MDPTPNVLTSAEPMHLGLAAIEQALRRSPVRLRKHNQATAFVIAEQRLRQLQTPAAQAAWPVIPALQWLINLPLAFASLSKPALNAKLAVERDW